MKVREVFQHWDEIREGLINTIKAMDPQHLEIKPVQDAMTIGDIFRHIAGAEVHWIQKVIQGSWNINAHFHKDKYSSRDDIIQLLNDAHTSTLDLLDFLKFSDLKKVCVSPRGEKFSIYWTVWHVIEHEIHHKGQIFRDLRNIGQPVNPAFGP